MRGIGRIGIICADGFRELEDVISEVLPGTKLQRCTTHLKLNIISDVRNSDKGDVAEDLRKEFRRGTRMHGAMPNEGFFVLLMGKMFMDKKFLPEAGAENRYRQKFVPRRIKNAHWQARLSMR